MPSAAKIIEEEENNVLPELEEKPVIEEMMVSEVPDCVVRLSNDYRAKIAHTFILHGNINDHQDNSGRRSNIKDLLARTLDCNYKASIAKTPADKKDALKGGVRVLAFFSISGGLEFIHEKSRKCWETIMQNCYSEIKDADEWQAILNPVDFAGALNTLNMWFRASKRLQAQNEEVHRSGVGDEKPEIGFRIAFLDADALFPAGPMAQLSTPDRNPIVYIRNWAQDEAIGNRNMIIMLARHALDIHESIRGGESRVSCILVKRPRLEEREAWIHNFGVIIKNQASQGQSMKMNGRVVTEVGYAKGFDAHLFGIQSAGMSRSQLEDVIMQSWLEQKLVDFTLVRTRKQRAIEEEYEGIIEFFEPETGFEVVGGHEHLKRYFMRKVIVPLQEGDRRVCSRGVLLSGPPGTGKTALAKALAKEAKMNFMVGNLGRLFGGIVGESESRTRKFLEAVESAAPVILFLDELDSVLSSGRTSTGDSGTAARMFNSLMTFLSDESRAGRVVVVAATNRPDLLDVALIRTGRFDAVLPALPPAPGDAEGRALILQALKNKHGIKWEKTLAATATSESKDNGLGRLLFDDRIWTGAEMEGIVKEAYNNAVFRIREEGKKSEEARIGLADWNQALDDILPNTREVEAMIDLALLYVNHLGYCPKEWRERASKKDELRSNQQSYYSNGLLNSDREI